MPGIPNKCPPPKKPESPVDARRWPILRYWPFVLVILTIVVFWWLWPERWEIAVEAGQGGEIVPAGTQYVATGSDVTFQILPDEGHFIECVEIDGHSIGVTSAYIFTNVTANHTIRAAFLPRSFSISFTNRVPNAGTNWFEIPLTGGPSERVTMSVGSFDTEYVTKVNDKPVTNSVNCGDAFLVVSNSAFTIDYWIRPNAASTTNPKSPYVYPFYKEPVRIDRLEHWSAHHPAATEHTFEAQLDFRKYGTPEVEADFWLDGRYVYTFTGDGLSTNIQFSAPWQNTRCVTGDPIRRELFTVLSVSARPAPGALSNATFVAGQAGMTTVTNTAGDKIPIDVTSPELSMDLGRVSAANFVPASSGNSYLSCYYGRSAFSGLRESMVFSVPRRWYRKAYVLCCLDSTDTKEKSLLTARLTRFSPLNRTAREGTVRGRGDAIADTTCNVTNDGERVHHITLKIAFDTNTTVYLVEIPLAIGEIQDLLTSDRNGAWGEGEYLDFELTCVDKDVDKWGLEPNGPGYEPIPYQPNIRSSVQILGVTLEETPAYMTCAATNNQCHVFYEETTNHVSVTVTENAGYRGKYVLESTFTDFEGRAVATRSSNLAFSSGPTADVILPLHARSIEPGWYGVEFLLKDAVAGKELMTLPSAFVVLPGSDDTRNAKQRSPYGTGWRGVGAQEGGTDALELIGPLLEKAGLRDVIHGRTMNPDTNYNPNSKVNLFRSEALSAYGMAPQFVKWHSTSNVGGSDWVSEMETFLNDRLEWYPSSTNALVLHERLGNDINTDQKVKFPFPTELFGKARTNDPDRITGIANNILTNAMANIAEYSAFCTSSNVNVVFGNTHWSGEVCAAFAKRGYPAHLFQYIGVRTVGGNVMPEKIHDHSIQSVLLLKETLRNTDELYTTTYSTIPITGCGPEWVVHPASALGMRQQAEWYVRDCLLALAYRFHALYPGGMMDSGSAYYHSGYGCGAGFFKRFPIMTPRPSYAAIATLTDVLDQMVYVTKVPTGSRSLYALQFANKTNSQDRVYALWTARGKRRVTAQWSSDTTARLVHMVGTSQHLQTANAQLTGLFVSTSPLYLQAQDHRATLEKITPKEHAEDMETAPSSHRNIKVIDGMTNEFAWKTEDDIGEPVVPVTNWWIWPYNWLDAPEGARWQLSNPLPNSRVDTPQQLEDKKRRRGSVRALPLRTLVSPQARQRDDGEWGTNGTVQCLGIDFGPADTNMTFLEDYAVVRLADKSLAWKSSPTNRPSAIGVWVKGGSQWGEIMFFFEDISTERYWLSCGLHANNSYDPTAKLGVNFDGWRLLTLDLPPASKPPDPVQWRSNTGGIACPGPIAPLGIVVTMPRYQAYVNELLPVTNRTIRLKDLCVIY